MSKVRTCCVIKCDAKGCNVCIQSLFKTMSRARKQIAQNDWSTGWSLNGAGNMLDFCPDHRPANPRKS